MYSLDKHMRELYGKLRHTDHSGIRLLADHIDDTYRNSEAETSEERLTEVYDELSTLLSTIELMRIHLDNYRKENL